MRFLKITPWGFILKANGVQYGCGVGVSPAEYMGRPLTVPEAKMARRHGLIVLP